MFSHLILLFSDFFHVLWQRGCKDILICSPFSVFKYQPILRGEKSITFSCHILFIFSNVVICFKNIFLIFLTKILFFRYILYLPLSVEIEYHIHFTSLFYHHMLYRSQPISTLQKTLKLEICPYTNCQFYFFPTYIHFLNIGIGLYKQYWTKIVRYIILRKTLFISSNTISRFRVLSQHGFRDLLVYHAFWLPHQWQNHFLLLYFFILFFRFLVTPVFYIYTLNSYQ